VDREAIIDRFGELENKIEHLIRTCKRFEAETSALKQENLQLNAQLQEKLAADRQNQELKDLVRSKIDSLMGRLDELSEE
jgi:regulator of replication initiation timing